MNDVAQYSGKKKLNKNINGYINVRKISLIIFLTPAISFILLIHYFNHLITIGIENRGNYFKLLLITINIQHKYFMNYLFYTNSFIHTINVIYIVTNVI